MTSDKERHRRQQGDEFVRSVLKGDPSPATFQDNVQYLRHRFGSARKAAKAAGIAHTTFGRWARGVTPKAASVDRIAARVREIRSAPSKMGDAGVIVKLHSQELRRNSRERDVWGGQLQLAPGTLAAAQAVWVSTGDSSEALRRFLDGVKEPWYRTQIALGTGNDDLLPDDWDEHAMESDYGVTIG